VENNAEQLGRKIAYFRGVIMKYKWNFHRIVFLIVILVYGISFAQESSYYLIQAQFEDCRHGLHAQPNGGPFSVFLFCDDALGSNIGVILTQPGAGPGNIKLNTEQIWDQWNTSDRFWQDNLWATDVVNFLWSPSLRYLYVATSGVYGNGGFFKLDLQARVSKCVLPDTSANYFSGLKTGYLTNIEKVDTENELITIGIYSYDETRMLIAKEEIPLE
jgi:hypothetical protein